jgi:hypothetical protein
VGLVGIDVADVTGCLGICGRFCSGVSGKGSGLG